ncbi:5-enolpyruvylshikimate-3-phosphate synthase [Prevotella sp. CAG:386]|nr:5-enolpyruvylshikimate-3-phosphate synthase [Prevotella sp. CAG:386]
MRRDGWVIDLGYLWIVLQILYYLQGILYVALYTEAQCLQALKKNPGIEWRDGGTGITKDDRTDSGYEGCCSGYICEYGTMIRWVWLGESRELVGIGLPVELTAIYDDTTERRTVTADELSGRVNHDVGSVLDRTDEIWSAEGVVDNQWDVVAMSNLCQLIDIGHI